jgi:hypothetical protein
LPTLVAYPWFTVRSLSVVEVFMRRSLAVLALLAAACTPAGDRTLANSGARFAFNDPSRIDTIGMPDLIVDEKSTENKWRIKTENLSANFCSVQEGGVTPGERRLLRFTVTTPNQGDADVYIGDPDKHYQANDGMYELSTCHGHYHFNNYATYELISAKTGKVWRAAKAGFCMLDTDPWLPELRDAPRNYYNCGYPGYPGFQGISKGWSDTYVWRLGGQYFVLDGGDGQKPVPEGWYIIQITVNPGYAPSASGCNLVTNTATGLCHNFAESNYTNNIGRVKVFIPASGPAGPYRNERDPTAAEEIDHAGQ